MKKILGSILLLVAFFYTIYPQALDVRGSSIISVTGIIGLVMFLVRGDYFSDLQSLIKAYLPILFFGLAAAIISGWFDPFLIDYPKSQLAWIFTAYLTTHFFFKIFPKGTLNLFLLFIISAIALQCIITIFMYMYPPVSDFFTSLAMKADIEELKRNQSEGVRLLGYGIAFFGAGIVCGGALILIIYVLMSRRFNLLQVMILCLLYVFIFYIGLFSARTTVVGLVTSLALLGYLILKKKSNTFQAYKFIGIGIIFLMIGYTLCFIYFPDFTDWAFELLNNYEGTGELRTNSSDGLEHMFYLPRDTQEWMFGIGVMYYWGTDVGYTRLLYYFGLTGTLSFFYFIYYILKKCVTKDTAFNATLFFLFIYNLGLNVKGFSDLSSFLFLLFFYFIIKKDYLRKDYIKHLQYQKRINANKLRLTLQNT